MLEQYLRGRRLQLSLQYLIQVRLEILATFFILLVVRLVDQEHQSLQDFVILLLELRPLAQ